MEIYGFQNWINGKSPFGRTPPLTHTNIHKQKWR